MRFGVSKESLLISLDRVSKIVKSNPRSVPILQCVHFYTYGDSVYLAASSSSCSARVEVHGAKVAEPGECAVNFDKIRDRVSKAGDTLVLDTTETTLRIVSSDDQKLGIALSDLREYPKVTWVEPEESYGLDKTDFVTALKQAASVSGSSSLTPALLQVSIQNQSIISGSGSTYQIIPLKCNPALSSTIPTNTIQGIVGFASDADSDSVWLSQGDTDNVVVSIGTDQFQSTPLAIEFPDLRDVFAAARVAAEYDCHVKRAALISELMKAKTSAGKYGTVTLQFSGTVIGKIQIDSSSDEGDWYTSTMECMWTGPEKTTTFVAEDLAKFLRTFGEDEVSLLLGDDFRGNPSIIYCKEGEHEGIINQFRV